MTDDPRRFFPIDRFGEVRTIVPIGEGLSGAAVYSVTTSAGEFILRTQGPDRASWRRAVAMQRLAADHGIAPALLFVDEDEAASVSVKVSGISFGAALAQPSIRRAALESVARTLAKLHAVALPDSAETSVDAEGLAPAIWASQLNRPGFPAWAARLGARLSEACSVLSGDPRRVFSHNDVHHMNIIWDGSRIWLIDWERAGLAHPYIDLATLSNFMNLSDDTAITLLGIQEGTAIDTKEQQVFREVRDFCRIVYGAVFLRLVPDLKSIEIAGREDTPTLAQCYQQMGRGALNPNTPRGQALLGAALLKQCE